MTRQVVTRHVLCMIAASTLLVTGCAIAQDSPVSPENDTGVTPQDLGGRVASEPSWQLKWSPEANQQGLKGFEGVEDDEAHSHPAVHPHIFVQGNDYRFNIHMVDRDSSPDRQRQEIKGMRTSSGAQIDIHLGETWRLAWSFYIPSELKATSSFSHIFQLKQPSDGGSPILVMSLRRRGSHAPTIELMVQATKTLVGEVPLASLQNKWLDTEVEFKVGNETDGSVRWVLRDGGTTLLDATKSGVDTFLADRVRPKWGIYRSLGDTTGSLQDAYLLLTQMRGYQLL